MGGTATGVARGGVAQAADRRRTLARKGRTGKCMPGTIRSSPDAYLPVSEAFDAGLDLPLRGGQRFVRARALGDRCVDGVVMAWRILEVAVEG